VLLVTGYSGDAGNAIIFTMDPSWIVYGMQFTTHDSDNDDNLNYNCASLLVSGWWFKECSASHLNTNGGATWTTGNTFGDVQISRMLVKVN